MLSQTSASSANRSDGRAIPREDSALSSLIETLNSSAVSPRHSPRESPRELPHRGTEATKRIDRGGGGPGSGFFGSRPAAAADSQAGRRQPGSNSSDAADHHHWLGWRPEDHDHIHESASAAVAAAVARRHTSESMSPSQRADSAPRMQMQVARMATPASSMVQPWSPADIPEAGGHHEHIKLINKAKMDKHNREMDRHVEEHLHSSYLHRKSIRHSLSVRTGYHDSWQGRLEEAVREASWAVSQVAGCCKRTVPGGAGGSRCCSASADAEDFGYLPGVTREY